MKIDWSLGVLGNIQKLYEERNHTNANLDNTNADLGQTKVTVNENQVISDETILDHEERLILLEVGE